MNETEVIILIVEAMREKHRVQLFEALRGRFCFGCGDREPAEGPCCQCRNDE